MLKLKKIPIYKEYQEYFCVAKAKNYRKKVSKYMLYYA